MAVTDSGTLADGTWGPRIDANGTRTYQIMMDATTDSEMAGHEVLEAMGILQFQTAHPNDPFALATEADAEQDQDDHNYWRCTYKYSTYLPELAQVSLAAGGGGTPSGADGHNPEDPLSWAPKVRYSTRTYKRVRWRDQDGRVYMTAAGEMMELPMKEYNRIVMHIQRNVRTFDVNLMNRVPNGVNIDSCMGYEARRLKCDRLTATPHNDKGGYWELDAEIIIGSPDDVNETIWPDVPADGWWWDKRLHAGYSYRELENGVWRSRQIIESSGQRPSRPRPLSSDGTEVLVLSNAADLARINFVYRRELTDSDFNRTGLFDQPRRRRP